MVSISSKPSLYRLALAAGLALAMTACGSLSPRQDPAAELPAEEEGGGEPGFERLPNPYLSQAGDVPADAQSRFSVALALMQAEDYQAALGQLQQLAQDYPELSGPLVNLGLVHRQLERPEDAVAALRRAIEVNKSNIDAYNQLAILQRELGDFAQAESLYLQALSVWPHSPDSHRNLGILYDLYMGRFDEALRHYEMAARLAEEPDRELQGWIADLQRRMHNEAN